MRELINQIWTLESFGNEKLAKYMRCLLKATLPMEHTIPMSLLEEISAMVKQLAEACSSTRQGYSLLQLLTLCIEQEAISTYGIRMDRHYSLQPWC